MAQNLAQVAGKNVCAALEARKTLAAARAGMA